MEEPAPDCGEKAPLPSTLGDRRSQLPFIHLPTMGLLGTCELVNVYRTGDGAVDAVAMRFRGLAA